jgi:mycothiol synthase
MVTQPTINNHIQVPDAPSIPGLTFRSFRGDVDLPLMLAMINGSKAEDGIERSSTLEEITNGYHHLEHCDPFQDMLLVEVDEQLIAYNRVFWEKQEDGTALYILFGYLLPAWRRKGIGTAMSGWAENRLRQIAAGHENSGERFFQANAADTEKGAIAMFEKSGYQPARYEFNMHRPISDPLPEALMPVGLEVRPVKDEHIRPIWDAMQEAFKDHWGFVLESDLKLQEWQSEPSFQPQLWKVAWEGDQVAGMVLNFINESENQEYKRLRGYTEGISVRRPWRKQGLARSLIVQSIQMFKDMGMTETALGVDSQNLSGALRLYQGVGYRQTKQFIVYRKPFK